MKDSDNNKKPQEHHDHKEVIWGLTIFVLMVAGMYFLSLWINK